MKSAIPAVIFDTDLIVVYAVLYGPLIVVPLCIGIAWWFWARPEQLTARKWRSRILLAGLLAGSGNVIIFYAWFTYRLFVALTPNARRIEDVCAGIGVFLSFAVFGAVIFGEGVSRIPLLVCAFFGWMMWGGFSLG